MHIVQVRLSAPGIGFELTPRDGALQTVRQTTLRFLNQVHAQVAINGHFFLPFPSADLHARVVGFAASNGNIYSPFEAPVQSYAIVANAPAINIDPSNHAGIVHADANFADGKHIRENVIVGNALAGSAQIVTNGVKTIPAYADAQNLRGLLTAGGPANYSNGHSWYNLTNARTAIGLSRDNKTLVLFTVDRAGGSLGMTVGEVADLLISDYAVYNALNLDGGGSTTLVMEDAFTHAGKIVNVSSDNPNGRSVASNLAIFSPSAPHHARKPIGKTTPLRRPTRRSSHALLLRASGLSPSRVKGWPQRPPGPGSFSATTQLWRSPRGSRRCPLFPPP